MKEKVGNTLTLKFFNTIGLMLLLGCYACTTDTEVETRQQIYTNSYPLLEKFTGVAFDNGPRQGFQYYDSTGKEFSYRYMTTTITNDSTVPIHLNISFSKEFNKAHFCDSLKSKVFLLPRELTPWRQQFDRSMSKELKQFLDTKTDVPVSLNEILNPNERCVMTFAVLTDMKYADFLHMELVSRYSPFHRTMRGSPTIGKNSNPISSALFLGLSLDNRYIIPCGQILF